MPPKTLINHGAVSLEVPLKRHPDLRTGDARGKFGNCSFSFPIHMSILYLRLITSFCCCQMHFEGKYTLNWQFTSADLYGGLYQSQSTELGKCLCPISPLLCEQMPFHRHQYVLATLCRVAPLLIGPIKIIKQKFPFFFLNWKLTMCR